MSRHVPAVSINCLEPSTKNANTKNLSHLRFLRFSFPATIMLENLTKTGDLKKKGKKTEATA